jgi:flagellar biogenesis protein FliO
MSVGADGPDLTRYICVCAALLVAITALAYGFRRLVGGTLRAKAARRSLEVLDMLPLGGKHKLAVVRCYDRAFVLGIGEKELALVAELDPVHAERAPAAPALEKAFAGVLRKARPLTPRSTRSSPQDELVPGGGVLG